MSYPRPGVPDIPLMVEAVADIWSRIGINVTIEKTEWGAIRPLVRGRQVNNFGAPITQGLASPDIIAILLGPPFYFFNTSAEITPAGAAVKGARTGEEMARALGELGDAVIKEYALVPISLPNQIYVVDPKTVGSWPVHAHQRAQVHRRDGTERDEVAVDVEAGGRAIAPFLDVGGKGRLHQGHQHLIGGRLEAATDDLGRDGINFCHFLSLEIVGTHSRADG